MTEREKMFAGKIYDPFAEGMPEERTRAHRLCKLYNDTFDTETEKREELIRQLTKEMKNASRLLEFEHAAILRDRIKELQQMK